MIRRSLVRLAFAMFAAAVFGQPLRAEMVYIPAPETGVPNSFSHILMKNRDNGPLGVNVAFIPTGTSAATVGAGRRVGIHSGRGTKIETLEFVRRRVGMLRLTGPELLDATHVAQYAKWGGDTQSSVWSLPVLSETNHFGAGATAFLEQMARNVDGVANVEIINLSDEEEAICSIEMTDAQGTSILPSATVRLPRLSHRVVRDIFGEAGITAIANGKAHVSCDTAFWAYGTFRSPKPQLFRVYSALRATPAPFIDTVGIDRNGAFFTCRQADPKLDLPIPLVPRLKYRLATVEFDVFIDKFTPLFTGLAGLTHLGGPQFNRTLYYGTFVRGRMSRSILDLGVPVLDANVKRSSPFKQKHTYHVRIIYDVDHNWMLWEAKENGNPILSIQSGLFNTDLSNSGNPVRLILGLGGIADGAYYPPFKWRFSNLKVRFQR